VKIAVAVPEASRLLIHVGGHAVGAAPAEKRCSIGKRNVGDRATGRRHGAGHLSVGAEHYARYVDGTDGGWATTG